MSEIKVRAARPGDGAALARAWLDNAHYYVERFRDDFRAPDADGLEAWFEEGLAERLSASELHLVASTWFRPVRRLR